MECVKKRKVEAKRGFLFLFIRGLLKKATRSLVELLVKATSTYFIIICENLQISLCHTLHVCNDDAVTFPNATSNSPGVAVDER